MVRSSYFARVVACILPPFYSYVWVLQFKSQPDCKLRQVWHTRTQTYNLSRNIFCQSPTPCLDAESDCRQKRKALDIRSGKEGHHLPERPRWNVGKERAIQIALTLPSFEPNEFPPLKEIVKNPMIKSLKRMQRKGGSADATFSQCVRKRREEPVLKCWLFL